MFLISKKVENVGCKNAVNLHLCPLGLLTEEGKLGCQAVTCFLKQESLMGLPKDSAATAKLEKKCRHCCWASNGSFTENFNL